MLQHPIYERTLKFLNLPIKPETIQEVKEVMVQNTALKPIEVALNYLQSVGYDASKHVLYNSI